MKKCFSECCLSIRMCPSLVSKQRVSIKIMVILYVTPCKVPNFLRSHHCTVLCCTELHCTVQFINYWWLHHNGFLSAVCNYTDGFKGVGSWTTMVETNKAKHRRINWDVKYKKPYVERMPLFHKTFYIWVVLCIYKVKKPGSASR
jgi:hypothetical protein